MTNKRNFACAALALSCAVLPISANAAVSVGLKLGSSDLSFRDAQGRVKETGIVYGADATWLTHIAKNFSLGVNFSYDSFENALYGSNDSEHTAITLSPVLSYRIFTLPARFCAGKRLKEHDGLSLYVKAGLGLAKSEIVQSVGAMKQDGAIGTWGAGIKWQAMNDVSFGVEYQVLDNGMYGLGSRDFGVESTNVVAMLGYRF